ncbi:MAG TPA: hypothetical protein VGF85_08610 [Opitutaceae bacterium]|jgi:hypothetical protein
MRQHDLVRNYFILPCCVLLLNLFAGVVSYKAKSIEDPLLETAVVMLMVLFGGSLIGFMVAPLIQFAVGVIHRRSKRRFGIIGEGAFLMALVVCIFWLYYRMYILGPEYLLPSAWRNGPAEAKRTIIYRSF